MSEKGQNLPLLKGSNVVCFLANSGRKLAPRFNRANQPILPEQTRTSVAFDFGVDVELGAGGHVGGHFDGRPNVGWVRDK